MTNVTLYTRLLAHAQKAEPAFAAPHAKETENAFGRRLVRVFSDIPDSREDDGHEDASLAWDDLEEDEQSWANDAFQAVKQEAKTLPDIPGYPYATAEKPAASGKGKKGSKKAVAEPEPEPEVEDKADPAPSQKTATSLARSERMKEINAARRARKAAAEKGEKPPVSANTTVPNLAKKPEKQATKSKVKAPKAETLFSIVCRFLIQTTDADFKELVAFLVPYEKAAGKQYSVATLRTMYSYIAPTIRTVRAEGYWKA